MKKSTLMVVAIILLASIVSLVSFKSCKNNTKGSKAITPSVNNIEIGENANEQRQKQVINVKKETTIEESSVNQKDIHMMAELTDLPLEELMDMAWNSWEISAYFKDADKVNKCIKEIPLKGLKVEDEIANSLIETISNISVQYGQGNLKGYINQLETSGESVIPEIESGLRTVLTDQMGVAKSDLEIKPFDLIKQFIELSQLKTHWDGLVATGSQVTFYESKTASPSVPGKDFKKIRNKIVSFHHVTTSPITPEQALETDGKLLFSDTTLFISHDEQTGNAIRPYVLRLWYDKESQLWRPLMMRSFPNPKENLPVQIIF